MLKKVLASILLIFSVASLTFFYLSQHRQLLRYPQDTIFRSQTVQIGVVSCPLQAGSLMVESIFPEKSLSQWNVRQHAESYHLLQNAAQLWKDHASIDNFLILAMIPPRMHADNFFWEIIPFSQNHSSKASQLLVLWRLIFGSSCLSKAERRGIKRDYQPYISFFSYAYAPLSENNLSHPIDIFCNPATVAKQLLFEGKQMNVLYNYAPLGVAEEKPHFLITPKAHRSDFTEVTLDEYLEAQEIASKLIQYYEKKGYPIAYLFHKSGEHAGQTVPHWHEHLVLARQPSHAFIGKLMVLHKMLFPHYPLSEEQLKKYVDIYSQQVQEALSDLTNDPATRNNYGKD